MIQLILSMVLMTGLSVTPTADEPKGDEQQTTAKAMESLSGSWEIVKVSPDGATKGAKRLVFKKNGAYAAVDEEGQKLWVGTFDVDPTASPKVWGYRSDDGKRKGTDVLGIYELDADSLKMACVVGQRKGKEWVGKGRPKTFDPKAADVVIELKREKTSK